MDEPRGDPDGRRLAKARAGRLAEAGRAGALMRGLLGRAGFPTADIDELLADVHGQETTELMRADGHVEPRKRFRGGSSQPLRDRRARSLLFVDESGTSVGGGATPFALGAVALTLDEAIAYRRRSERVKRQFFGEQPMTLHEPDMRNHDGPYWFDGDTARQAEFDAAIDDLVAGTNFVAFGAAVRRGALDRFLADTTDPYLPHDLYSVAIQMLLERFVDYLATSAPGQPLGRLTFESQGAREDAEHARDYIATLLDGTQWVPGKSFRQWLEPSVRFTPKQGSDPMELADMLARDIHEWVRDDASVEPRRWGVWHPKMHHRDDGQRGKFGVKVFPDGDIRDLILAHRAACAATGN